MMAFLDWRSDEVEEEKEEKRVLVAVRIKRAIGVLAREIFFFFFGGFKVWVFFSTSLRKSPKYKGDFD